jgi:hypothetical protein
MIPIPFLPLPLPLATATATAITTSPQTDSHNEVGLQAFVHGLASSCPTGTGIVVVTLFMIAIAMNIMTLTKHTDDEICLCGIVKLTRSGFTLLGGFFAMTLGLLFSSHDNATESRMILTLISLTITLGILAYTRRISKARLKEISEKTGIMSLVIKSPQGSVELILIKTEEKWPHVTLSMRGGEFQPAQPLSSPNSNLKNLEGYLEYSGILSNPKVREEIKRVLITNGVSHPIDIEHHGATPTLKTFFYDLLLPEKP